MDGMRNSNGNIIREPQGLGLSSPRVKELRREDSDCRNSRGFKGNNVVQTARGAGPSVRETLDDGVARSHDFLEEFLGGRSSEGGLPSPKDRLQRNLTAKEFL